MERIQVLLDKKQQEYLARVAKKTGKSVSALLRQLVDEKMLTAKEAHLRNVARELRATYATQKDLTEFTTLDSEDWYA